MKTWQPGELLATEGGVGLVVYRLVVYADHACLYPAGLSHAYGDDLGDCAEERGLGDYAAVGLAAEPYFIRGIWSSFLDA